MAFDNVDDGRKRVVISHLVPEIDGGHFPVKRLVGQSLTVSCDAFIDGDEVIVCALRYRFVGAREWQVIPMVCGEHDRWQGSFIPEQEGSYEYTVSARLDPFQTWHRQLRLSLGHQDDDEVLNVLIQQGGGLINSLAGEASADDADWLRGQADAISEGQMTARDIVDNDELIIRMAAISDHRFTCDYGRTLPLLVESPLAGFSTGYELFPRSCSSTPGQYGTFEDCRNHLNRIAAMGFDVLYLPPIHPIAGDGQGSPWLIGTAEGGHKSVHPELGTLEDFSALVDAAQALGMLISLEISLRCSAEHPYVREHPNWFKTRLPSSEFCDFDFNSYDWRSLWEELLDVFRFWIDRGVKLFRVDNPQNQPYPFWQWLLAEIRKDNPDVVFLAATYTRPKPLAYLAKLGFSQSYTYFPWRNGKDELQQLMIALQRYPERDYFRPSFWPNTPDILSRVLQSGGRPAFMQRLVLAATLSSNYAIYGPAYELMENAAEGGDSERYLNSEKFQLRHWNFDQQDSLSTFIAKINEARHQSPALQQDANLRFHDTGNPLLMCYSKWDDLQTDRILVVVNLDCRNSQSGMVHLQSGWAEFQLEDLLTGNHYRWTGMNNYVELTPWNLPAHIFRVQSIMVDV